MTSSSEMRRAVRSLAARPWFSVAAIASLAFGIGANATVFTIVNALLFPYLNNAVRLSEQGTASIADIDTAMKGGCNFPMGPFALLDLVGLDTSVAILDALYTEFRDPTYSPVPTLRRMVAAGRLGRKTGRGFFEYSR